MIHGNCIIQNIFQPSRSFSKSCCCGQVFPLFLSTPFPHPLPPPPILFVCLFVWFCFVCFFFFFFCSHIPISTWLKGRKFTKPHRNTCTNLCLFKKTTHIHKTTWKHLLLCRLGCGLFNWEVTKCINEPPEISGYDNQILLSHKQIFIPTYYNIISTQPH